MRKTISSISIFCLMSFTLFSNIPLQAGGCNSHKNKKAEIECQVNDTECIQKKAKEKFKNFDV